MVDLQIGHVPAASPSMDQPVIHLFVFTGQEPRRSSGTEILRVWADTPQRRALDDGVSPFQDSGEIRSKGLFSESGADLSKHGEVIGRDPFRRLFCPNGEIRATDEVELRVVCEGLMDGLEPSAIDFLVVVDHADEVTVCGRDSRVQCPRLSAPSFTNHSDPRFVLGPQPFQKCGCFVGRTVIDDDDVHRQPVRH